MHSLQIQRLTNPMDSRITDFRSKVCEENGAKKNYINNTSLDYKNTVKYVNQLSSPNKNFEEIWKYGNTKWTITKFDALECVFYNNLIISLSGCKAYTNNMLRVSMHLYTLINYRKICRNFQFRKNGFFQRHLDFAKKIGNIECLFMTVYPHNKKLKAHVHNLAYRKISPDGKKHNMHFIDKLQFIDEPIIFHNVPQYFFLYPLNKSFQFPKELPKPKNLNYYMEDI